jgi:hypothetical protein
MPLAQQQQQKKSSYATAVTVLIVELHTQVKGD